MEGYAIRVCLSGGPNWNLVICDDLPWLQRKFIATSRPSQTPPEPSLHAAAVARRSPTIR